MRKIERNYKKKNKQGAFSIMKKNILFSVLTLCFLISAFGQSKPNVVIVPFDAKGVPQDEADVVTELFISEYAATGKATVPDRNSFDKLAKEQSFQASSWSDSEKIAKLGKAINANQAIVGQIMKFRDEIIVSIKVIDINTTKILSSKTERLKDISLLFDKIPGICKELAEKSNYVPMQYKVGDEGEGGGIVFYVSQEGFVVYDGMGGEKLCHYLEMSNSTLGLSEWTPGKSAFINTICYKSFGYGKSNTYKILNYYKNSDLSEENCAAYRCSVYSTEKAAAGEWFLPSKDELNEMYKAMNKTVISDATYNLFWTSSEMGGDNLACGQWFGDGEQDNYGKDYTCSVRAVRAF